MASLRAYFMALIALATVPMTVLAALLIAQQARSGQAQMASDLQRAASSFALTVEREIASSTDALRILSLSEPLQRGDIAGIFTSMSAAPKPRNSWSSAFLVNLEGDVLFNTQQPRGHPLGKFADMPALERLKLSGQAVMTDLTIGPDGQPSTGILVPVIVQGRITGALGAWIPPASWKRLITTTVPMQNGFMSIFDSQRRIIARNTGSAQVVGRPLPSLTQDRMRAQGPSGVGEIGVVEGGHAYGAWHTIAPTGWGVVIGESAEPVNRAYFMSIGAALAMGVLSLLAGMVMALWVARRVTGPLSRLARHGPHTTPAHSTVHELHQLEEALQEAERQRESARERLQAKADEIETLFQSSPIGLAITQTSDCESVLRNPALCRMLNEPEQADNHTPPPLPRTGWPQHQVRRQGRALPLHEQPLQKAARTGERQRDIEIDVIHEDGRTLKLVVHAVPLLDAHGRPRGAIATFTDITERKQAEESLSTAERRLRESQHLMELAQAVGHVGFFHQDFQVNRVTWTSGLSKLFGLEIADFVGPWQEWLRRLEPSDREAVQKAIERAAAAGDQHITFEFRVMLPDGSRRWLSTRVSILYDGQGHPMQMHGAVVDVTQQKFIDQERAALVERETQARMEAESANRAKDEFLAMLGHELRNPLGAVSAACEVLNRAQSQEEVSQRARLIITRQTRHLGRLMDDLLDVARVISGKVLLVREPLRLDQLAHRVVNTFEMAGQLQGHQVDTRLQETWVHADMTRMEQVITNLLGNAIKYTPQGGHIQLCVERQGADAVVSVQDSGIGMSSELMARAFDLFAQGERSLDRRQGGLGIGLTLVKRLVELHGGNVQVSSPGVQQGSTFTLHLPAIEANASVQHQAARPVHGCKVVVVEDNDDAREALCAMLTLGQHETASAVDGAQGLALIEQLRPDVALIDIGLPEMTGYEVAQSLRERGYRGHLVALSGYGQPEDLERSRAAGFDEHLVKPVTADKLDRVMTRHAPAPTQQDHQPQP
ncbi:MAG: ATP-binding protein [Aquabacterium sp.]